MATPSLRSFMAGGNGVVLAGLALWWGLCLLHLAPQWYYLPNYGYGWSVPFLCVYLFAERWADAPTPAPVSGSTRGLAIGLGLAGALFLAIRVLQVANPGWRPLQWISGLLVIGATLTLIHRLGGRPWLRHFWFPVAFFLTSIPWRTSFETHLIQALSRLNAASTVHMLAWLGVPVIQHGNVIETSRGWAGIDEACSGIRSLQATLMLGLFFGELYRLRVGPRLFLFISGLSLALLCNAVRTLTLVWICDREGLAAMERWHDPTGVALLLGCFTGLWLLGRAGRRTVASIQRTVDSGQKTHDSGRTTDEAPRPAPRAQPPASPSLPAWLGPALIAMLVGVEAATEGWYRFHERGARSAGTWVVRWPPPREGWKEVTVPAKAVSVLRYQEGKAAAWTYRDGRAWQFYFFIWKGGGVESQLAANHTPDVCLPASGRTLVRQEPVRNFVVGGLKLPFQRYIFRDRGGLLYAFHCRWEDVLTQGPREREDWKVASRFDAVRYGRRNVGQRTLELIARGYPDLATAEAALQQELNALVERTVDGRRPL